MMFFAVCSVRVPAFAKRSARSIEKANSLQAACLPPSSVRLCASRRSRLDADFVERLCAVPAHSCSSKSSRGFSGVSKVKASCSPVEFGKNIVRTFTRVNDVLTCRFSLVEKLCPRRESNPHLRFRKPSFYPLNYGDSRISHSRFAKADCPVDSAPCPSRRLALHSNAPLRRSAPPRRGNLVELLATRIMPVHPDALVILPGPMPRDPFPAHPALNVKRAVRIIRPVANRNYQVCRIHNRYRRNRTCAEQNAQ